MCFSKSISLSVLRSEESLFSSLLMALTWPLRLLSSGVHQPRDLLLIVWTLWGQTLSNAWVISVLSFSASASSVCIDQFWGLSYFCIAINVWNLTSWPFWSFYKHQQDVFESSHWMISIYDLSNSSHHELSGYSLYPQEDLTLRWCLLLIDLWHNHRYTCFLYCKQISCSRLWNPQRFLLYDLQNDSSTVLNEHLNQLKLWYLYQWFLNIQHICLCCLSPLEMWYLGMD